MFMRIVGMVLFIDWRLFIGVRGNWGQVPINELIGT
jgi:hypothetical protein